MSGRKARDNAHMLSRSQGWDPDPITGEDTVGAGWMAEKSL
jgi:hypothetical protein